MSIDVGFVYYRNFRFDGAFHVRCSGNDLGKVREIRYVLERTGPDEADHVDAMTVQSMAQSGALRDHGCPVTLRSDITPGTYRITPNIRLTDEEIIARDLPSDASGVVVMEPLVMVIEEGESTRSVLDKVPLPASAGRRRRDVPDLSETTGPVHDPFGERQPQLPVLENGERFPPLLVKFKAGGFERFLFDLDPASNSFVVRHWPNLKQVLKPRPLLEEQEQQDESLKALWHFYLIEQPESMHNDTFAELIKTLAPLDYLEAIHFLIPEVESGNVVVAGVAAVVATLITGATVVAGNRAQDAAQPTPDFEVLQTYLDQPGQRWKGMNIRTVWDQQVIGRGARVHFSDGGLYPNHEDLRGNPDLHVVGLSPNDNPHHGTASVGLLLARSNAFGMTGICHASELYMYDNRATDTRDQWQTPKDLLRHVRPGDIVAVNRQTANINVLSTFLPSLHDQLWWDSTRALTQRGAVVVNAASNGSNATDASKGVTRGYGVDLSQWRYFEDLGDADAILIGACQSWDGKAHQYSNYGYRYRMLNAWGDSVATLGYGELQDKAGNDRDYTNTYAGTSSATPLVTGALALIQSYAIEHHHIYLNANQMHLLVMESGYLDATLPHTDVLPMGARPNVHGALVLLDRILGGGRFHPVKDEL
jgi:hypothetical protein